jgi:subtilisin family serine protease
MKRTVLAILLLASTAAFAADTQRYIIGTKKPVREGAAAAVKLMIGEDFVPRTVVPFESLNGFAADLTEADLALARQSSAVRWIEPVLARHKFLQPRNPMKQTVPLGLRAIFAPQAQTGLSKAIINVVVIDTGIDYNHPDLKDAYAGGRNVMNNSDDPLDDDGHGTHVSGTIAAADNDIGVLGVSPKVRLWSVKMLDGQGNGTSEGIIKALDWVTAKKEALGGNWIINLSLGATTESTGEREAFQRIADKGVLVVAAAGNLSTANTPAPVAFPAAYPSVVAVAATTFDQQHASFSNQGPELDLSAPGVDVLSTLPTGTHEISYVADGESATLVHELTGSKRAVVSGEFVDCGFGLAGQFPSTVAGKIALIKRGEISFAEKTRRAKEAGAIAVAIFDNVPVPTPGSWTLFNNDDDRAYDWPVALRLTQQLGEELLQKGSHTITIAFTNDDYGENSGTSMSCPHVVGSAALVWALAPDATAEQVVNALLTTATDLGVTGPDPLFGVGVINVNAAAHVLAPNGFPITTGRPVGMRGRR